MIIDITNEFITDIKSDLSGIPVYTHYPKTKPSFPCVIIEEMQNDDYQNTRDSSGQTHCQIGFEINILSNKSQPVTEVKGIRDLIDLVATGDYGLVRTFSRAVPNYIDDNIYRYVIRYIGVINENKTIYRR